MENDKDQMIERNDEITTSTQEGPLESHVSTGKININDINKRNAEQEKQEKKSSYTLIGAIALLVVFVIVVIYFLS